MRKFFNKDKINIENLTYIFFNIYILVLILSEIVIVLDNRILIMSFKAIRYSCYLFFLIKILIDFYYERNIKIVTIIALIISVMTLIIAKNTTLSILCIIFLALKKCDLNKLIVNIFNIYASIFFAVISLAALNVIPDWIYYRGDIVRHSLGFSYPTDCISFYLIIVLMYVYVKKEKITIIEVLSLETLNIFLYKYTDGRTSFLLITAILIIVIISKVKFIYNPLSKSILLKISKIVSYCLPIFLFILYNFLTFMFIRNDNVAQKINIALTDRLQLTGSAYLNYGIPLFGDEIKWNGWGGYGYRDKINITEFKYNFVDSSYAKLIFDIGIIPTLMIIVSYTIILVKNYKEKNYWLLLILLFILIWSFIEPRLIDITKNPLVLVLIPMLDVGKSISINKLENKKVKK